MRGAILSMAVLMTAATTPAQAETPTIRTFRATPPTHVAIPYTPRPPTLIPVMPRMISTPAPPHCPPPAPKPPLSVSIRKPDYNRRTMALIQQNIVMLSAMRAAETSRPCDPSWSARKLARKGCPPAQLAPEPIREPGPPPPPLGRETIAEAATQAPIEFGAGQN